MTMIKSAITILSVFVFMASSRADIPKADGIYSDPVLRKLQILADAGDTNIQYELGLIFASGKAVPRNAQQAAIWYRRAAEKGHSNAQVNLGWQYELGDGVPQDFVEAKRLYFLAAELQNSIALNNLGALYEHGRGVPLNYTTAMEWYRKASALGNARAFRNQGLLHAYGKGGSRDYEIALALYLRAAELGDDLVYTNLGWLYEQGLGVPQDDKKAAEWYSKGASKNDVFAQTNLAIFYERGRGVKRDLELAIELYKKAAEDGYALAQYNLGYNYRKGVGVERNYETAIYWYRKAAEQGYQSAQNNLGFMYENGYGVPKDLKLAAEWRRKAAESELANLDLEKSQGKKSFEFQEANYRILILNSKGKAPRFAEGKWDTEGEDKKTLGYLTAELLLSDNMQAILDAWNSPSEKVEFVKVDKTQFENTLSAFVIYNGCQRNSNGHCTLSISHRVFSPDGNLYQVSALGFLMNNLPFSNETSLSSPIKLQIPTTEQSGKYLLEVRIHDLVSDDVIELRKTFDIFN